MTDHHRLRDQGVAGEVGDRVAPGTGLLDVEIDEADVVIGAAAGGIVREIRNEPWHRVEVGAIVGLIEE